jgi:hypothetical protein
MKMGNSEKKTRNRDEQDQDADTVPGYWCTIGGELLLANCLANSSFFLFELKDLDPGLTLTAFGRDSLARSVSCPVFTSEHPETKQDANTAQQSAQTIVRDFILFSQQKRRSNCRVLPTGPDRLHVRVAWGDPLDHASTRGSPQ